MHVKMFGIVPEHGQQSKWEYHSFIYSTYVLVYVPESGFSTDMAKKKIPAF
jgi:hypothetical protein